MARTPSSDRSHSGHHHDHDDHDHSGHAPGHEHDAHEHGHDHSEHDHDHSAHDHEDHDHSGHDHGDHDHHDHSHDYREAGRRRLFISLFLIGGFMFAELIGGILSGSLALLADAGHMVTDAMAIGLALVALWIGDRVESAERTYGFRRAEVVAAAMNAVSLWIIVAWICFEAFHRLTADEVHIEGGLMLIVGGLGLIVNIIVAWILHASSEHSLNVEGAFWHVMGDLLGSVGVIISGVVIITTGWTLIDPILSVVIALLILWSSWGLAKKVLAVLLEGVPPHIDVEKLCGEIEDLPHVTLLHDIHVWSIASGFESMTAHVLVDPELDPQEKDALLRRIRQIAREDHGIHHVTIQIEQTVSGCTEDHLVSYLLQRARQII